MEDKELYELATQEISAGITRARNSMGLKGCLAIPYGTEAYAVATLKIEPVTHESRRKENDDG